MAYSALKKNKPKISNEDIKNSVLQTSKYQSPESLKEDKISNALPDYKLFISISEAFENSLIQLEVCDNHKEVYEKLLKIEKLVKAKISFLKKFIVRGSISEYHLKGENLSQSSWQSVQSLCSQTSASSVSSSYLNDDPDFLDFLKRVDCPFCSETQCNKTALILHLVKECTTSNFSDLKKKDFVPFSVFQILPNNTYKCNVCPNSVLRSLKHYFYHAKSFSHTSLCNHLAKTKPLCHSLFCSSCKIQIPNNYTQINFHINHESHITSVSTSKILKEHLKKEGTCCLYNKGKKFKCLVCHFKFTCETFEKMKGHLQEPVHTAKFTELLYCEVCSVGVHLSKFNKHLSSSKHINNEKKCTENSFELCLYCSFKCDTKMTLFLHMKSQCTVINDINEKYKVVQNSTEQDVKGKTEEVDIEEHDNEGNFLVVKGYTDIPELLFYFMQFGNIETIKIYNEKDVLIKFSQKSSLEDVLLFEFSHKINGKTLDITTDQNYFKDKKGTKEEKNIHSEISDCHVSFNEKGCDKIRDTDLNFDTVLQGDEELVNLFQRAVNHLMRDKQNLDTAKLLKEGVNETVQFGHCSFVGFLESELSLSVESVSLHIHINEILDTDSTLIENDPRINDAIWVDTYKKLCRSDMWENVELINSEFDIPHIKCVHKQIKKPCTITLMRFPKMLSLMLRDCVTENDLVRSFCMLVRFWVSVRGLAIKQFDYVLISLLVYFLKSQNIVKISFEAYKYRTRAALLDEAILGESISSQFLPSKVNGQFFNIKELFQEFMKFLITFNFDKYAICLPLDYPVPRKFLKEVKYIDILSKLSNPGKLEKSPMCILDPLLHINMASDIKRSDVRSFLHAARTSRKS